MRLNTLICEFLTGTGFFEGDRVAWEEAQKVKKSQRRLWERYSVVPISFFFYLARIGAMNKPDIPKHHVKLGLLLDTLRLCHYRDDEGKSHRDYIFRTILKAEIQEPDFSLLIGR
jgi:hypothetical protein